MLIWLLLTCGDPAFDGLDEALDAMAKGHAALEADDPRAAVEAFAQAAAADPTRASPVAWQAWAEDRAGRSEAALVVLDAGVSRFPRDPDLRYNRAAIQARLGQIEAAATDLRWLYANDMAQPVEVADDVDFLALGTHPELRRLLPSVQVSAMVAGEPKSVVLGERFTLELDVVGRKGATVAVQDMGQQGGFFRHVRTIEDVEAPERVWTRRHFRVEFQAVSAGKVSLGPWLVSAAGTSALTETIQIEVVDLPGRTLRNGPTNNGNLRVPSGWIGEIEPPWLGVVDGQRWAVLPPRHSIRPVSARGDGPDLELRDRGQMVWRAIPLLPDVSVSIVNAGTIVREDPPG
jgi:hypothetical protein